MYSLNGFGAMLRDHVRVDAYSRALKAAVRRDSVVLEIGTGPGFFAVLAHRLGARRVIAVEPDDAIQIAREVAADNGCGSIEFHQGLSTELDLDEPATIIVSDLRGVVPLFGNHIPSIVDARRRLLAPNGLMIPAKDLLYASVLEDEGAHAFVSSPWRQRPEGIVLEAGARRMAHQWKKVEPLDSQLLSAPALLGTLDYRTIESANFTGAVDLPISRAGVGHGLVVWFDANLLESFGFSNAPSSAGSSRAIYGCAFFPFPEPVPMVRGDWVHAQLRGNLVNDAYVWCWNSSVRETAEPGTEKCAFQQSSFAGEVMSASKLRRQSAKFRPQLNEDGRIDLAILEDMREGLDLAEIARRVAAANPSRFPSWRVALARVGELSLQYSI